MALHEVDPNKINLRGYAVGMVDEFAASGIKMAEVDVPDDTNAKSLAYSLRSAAYLRGYKMIKVHRKKDHVYLVRV